jgi:hypothetical protein
LPGGKIDDRLSGPGGRPALSARRKMHHGIPRCPREGETQNQQSDQDQ